MFRFKHVIDSDLSKLDKQLQLLYNLRAFRLPVYWVLCHASYARPVDFVHAHTILKDMNNRSAYIKRTGTSSDMHIYILELWITSLEIFQQTWRVICYLAAHDISHKDYCLKISIITFQNKYYYTKIWTIDWRTIQPSQIISICFLFSFIICD